MTILGQERFNQLSSIGETALNEGLRFIIVLLTLAGGTAQQLDVPANAVPVGVARTVSGGAPGFLTATVAATTLTVSSSSGTDTSTVAVLLIKG